MCSFFGIVLHEKNIILNLSNFQTRNGIELGRKLLQENTL